MKDKGSRISGSSNRTRGDKDGGRKDEESVRLADTKVYQRCSKVLRIGKLLLSIHSSFVSIVRPLYDMVKKEQK